jgi:hypothetical protein
VERSLDEALIADGNGNGNGDGDGDDDDDDDDMEPDAPDGELSLSDDLDFKYNPGDPAGLRLGRLSADVAARYHLMKAASLKSGRFEEWKQCLRSTVVELSSTISIQNLTNARSKKAASDILQELQQYVRSFYIILQSLISSFT